MSCFRFALHFRQKDAYQCQRLSHMQFLMLSLGFKGGRVLDWISYSQLTGKARKKQCRLQTASGSISDRSTSIYLT